VADDLTAAANCTSPVRSLCCGTNGDRAAALAGRRTRRSQKRFDAGGLVRSMVGGRSGQRSGWFKARASSAAQPSGRVPGQPQLLGRGQGILRPGEDQDSDAGGRRRVGSGHSQPGCASALPQASEWPEQAARRDRRGNAFRYAGEEPDAALPGGATFPGEGEWVELTRGLSPVAETLVAASRMPCGKGFVARPTSS